MPCRFGNRYWCFLQPTANHRKSMFCAQNIMCIVFSPVIWHNKQNTSQSLYLCISVSVGTVCIQGLPEISRSLRASHSDTTAYHWKYCRQDDDCQDTSANAMNDQGCKSHCIKQSMLQFTDAAQVKFVPSPSKKSDVNQATNKTVCNKIFFVRRVG